MIPDSPGPVPSDGQGRARFPRVLRVSLRLVAAACLALTPLRLLERSPLASPQYVLVLDDSPSVRRRFPGFLEEARAQWAAFLGGNHPIVAAGEHPRPEGTTGEQNRFTDLPAALRAAATLGRPHVETRILLATDGLTRDEHWEETGQLLEERAAQVWALSPPTPQPQARAVRIVLPERVFLWEPFTVQVQVRASRPGSLSVTLARNGTVTAEAKVVIDGTGSGDAEFPQELERVGRVRYSAAVAGDSTPSVEGEVVVAQSPRVRWLSEDAAASGPLVGLFRAAGIDVVLSHPADLLFPGQDLARDEVIVLDDLPVPMLGDALVDALRRAVGSGGAGLVVIGGRKGLGSGEYADTPVESLLPVKAGFRSPPPPESVALVLAFDTSFSMAYRGRAGGAHGTDPRKIDVAKESAEAVVRIVRPGDRLGILGNSTNIFWIAPLGEVVDREAVLDRITQVRPEGDGIYFYSVLHEAREALRRDPRGVRHVLVLCDAEDIDQYEVVGRGHAYDLLRDMAQEGITVTILAIGGPTDKDVPFLRTAALLGRGDFYLVQGIAAMPRYFVSEYRRLSSAKHFLEEEVQPIVGEQAALGAAGSARAYPPLTGMSLLTAREGTRTSMLAPFGAPLLVSGEYGRGRTTVFAGDNGYRWASRWVGASVTRAFWLQLLFNAAPSGARAPGFASTLEIDTDTGHLHLRHGGGGAAFPPWDALWVLPAEGESGVSMRLDRVGLRSYRSTSPVAASSYRRVRIAEDLEGQNTLQTTGYAIPVTDEDLPSAPRWARIEQLLDRTGGRWVESPAEMVRTSKSIERVRSLLPGLLIVVAVVLLLAEVMVRAFWED